MYITTLTLMSCELIRMLHILTCCIIYFVNYNLCAMHALSYLRFLFCVSRTSASEEIKKDSRFISMEEEEKGKKKALTRIPLQSGGNYPRQTHESTLFSPHWLPPRACVFRSEPHNMRRPTDRCGLSQLGQGKRGGKKRNTQHKQETKKRRKKKTLW